MPIMHELARDLPKYTQEASFTRWSEYILQILVPPNMLLLCLR